MDNEAARLAVITYFEAAHAAHASVNTIEVVYPNQKPPDIEFRESPFILLDILLVSKEQFEMGSRDFNTTKMLDISLWSREYTGIKLVDGYLNFVDSIGVVTVEGVVYGTPVPVSEKDRYKGWKITSVALPFKF